jgi:hypothetical protein
MPKDGSSIGGQQTAPNQNNASSRDGTANKEQDARLRDELRQEIAKAAYYRAHTRGFAPGYEEKDWLEAEAEILKQRSQSR